MESIEVFAGNIVEVGLVQSLLDKEGIQSWLKDEVMGTLNPWYTSPGGAGAIKVLVLNLTLKKQNQLLKNMKK